MLLGLVAVTACDGVATGLLEMQHRDSGAGPSAGGAGGGGPATTAGGGAGGAGGVSTEPPVAPVRVTSVRRLSAREVEATLSALLHRTITNAAPRLPEDRTSVENPFDNDRTAQQTSEGGLAEGYQSLVRELVSEAFSGAGSSKALSRDTLMAGQGTAVPGASARPGGLSIWNALSFSFAAPRTGQYRLVIRAYGEQVPPDPARMSVAVDGVVLETFDVSATVFTNYAVALPLTSATHTVTVRFLNDAFDGGTSDRNLIIESASLESSPQPGLIATLAGCTPAAAEDAACLERLIRAFGRRALRRPLTELEVAALKPLGALGAQAGEFDFAARTVVMALLSHPEFLFRAEAGDAPSGKLTPFEVASKLSFALIGAGPDDWLLDLAAADALQTRAQRKAAVQQLLADPRAVTQVRRFHALWLGYGGLGASSQPFLDETNALIDDTVFGAPKDHFTLLTSNRTFVSSPLAAHYGLPPPGNPAGGWVNYPTPSRGGILSHATFLSVQPSGGEASPTHRGRWVMTRFLCRTIGAAPGSVTITPPPPGSCRREYLTKVHATGSCQSCHSQMDPIGFGLERFGLDGIERGAELGTPACGLSGEGGLPGVGSFNGPRGLGALLAGQTAVEACLVRHVLRFAEGRMEDVSGDRPSLDAALTAFRGSQRDFRTLLTELTSHDDFISRRTAP